MMTATATDVLPVPAGLTLTSLGHPLGSLGRLRDSRAIAGDPAALRQQYAEDGYLYLPGLLDPAQILAARRAIFRTLAEAGEIEVVDGDLMAGRLSASQRQVFALDAAPTFASADGATRNPDKLGAFRPELAAQCPEIRDIVFGSRLGDFYRAFFGHEQRAFDFIWTRLMGPGHGTPVHCDNVYMGRGSADLMTCWIPYGEIPLSVGGLIVLEGSHQRRDQLATYLAKDVDAYCENRPAEVQRVVTEGGWSFPGWLSTRPDKMPATLGGRWLTAERWMPGDVITFGMGLVHASLDNQSDVVRFSTDTRYQPAHHPIDERWIGTHPPGHGRAGKRGRIC